MTDRIIKMKQIRTVTVLAIIVILCAIGIFRLLMEPDRGIYTGMNTDKYIELADYSHLKTDMKSDDPASLKKQIWAEVLENTEVKKYPRKQVKAYLKENLVHYEKLASDYGYQNLNDYIKNDLSIEKEAFEEQLRIYAESQVKNDLTVCAIAEKEGITISEKEYAELLEGTLKESGLKRAEFEDLFGMSLEEYAKEKHMRLNFLQDKVLQAIMEKLKEK